MYLDLYYIFIFNINFTFDRALSSIGRRVVDF